MKLSDYLDLDATVFNPIRYYDGEFLMPFLATSLNCNAMLSDNAIVENGKNLFDEYVKKEYLQPLANILENRTGHIYPYFVINKLDYEKRKSTKFYYLGYILENFYGMNVIPNEKKNKMFLLQDYDKIKTYYRNLLNEQMSKYSTLIKNINNPRYDELKNLAMEDYKVYCNKIYIKISFEDFLKLRINELKKEIKAINKLFNLFNKKIDTNKLMECFDFDTLALLSAYTSILQCETNLGIYNKVDYCLEVCQYYVQAVEQLRKNGLSNYNHSICVDKITGKTIDSNEVLRRYKKIRDEHLEYVSVQLDSDDIGKVLSQANKSAFLQDDVDLSTEEGAKLLDSAIEAIVEQKALKASWKIIPKGVAKENSEKIIHKIHTEITDQEAARRVEYSYKFFEYNADIKDKKARRSKTKYLYSLQGVGGFEGYTAYIYPTGKVVFEIYFEDEKTFKPVKYHATYVTDLYHFIELSKLSKQKVTEKLRKDSRLGKKFYHRKNMHKWADEIERSIGTIDYTDDVIAYINNLLKSGELSATNFSKK